MDGDGVRVALPIPRAPQSPSDPGVNPGALGPVSSHSWQGFPPEGIQKGGVSPVLARRALLEGNFD